MTNKKRFDKEPGIPEKSANVPKEKNNAQSCGNDQLHQITSGAGVDV
jgi:hypothetical protein